MDIAESAGMGLTVGLVVMAVGLVLWWQARRKAGLAVLLVGVLIAAGASIADMLLESEREHVERTLVEMVEAFAREDPEFFDYISPSAPELKALASGAMAMVTVGDDLRITDVDAEMLADNSRANVHFRANATIDVRGAGNVGYQPTRWRVAFQKEADEWKLIRVTRLNPVSGESMSILEARPN